MEVIISLVYKDFILLIIDCFTLDPKSVCKKNSVTVGSHLCYKCFKVLWKAGTDPPFNAGLYGVYNCMGSYLGG